MNQSLLQTQTFPNKNVKFQFLFLQGEPSVPHAQPTHVLENVSYAIVVVGLDGRVSYLNSQARRFLHKKGRTARGCIGLPSERLLPLATPLVKKAFLSPEFKAGKGRIVDRGVELFFEITPYMVEEKLQGAVVSLQRPARFEELATKLDSYQKVARQLQAVFDSSSDGILVTDGTGRILSMNRASQALNGLNTRTFVDQRIETLVDKGIVDRSVTQAVLRDKKQSSLIQYIPRTGLKLLVTGTPAFDKNGKIALVVVNERDITELNNLRRNLDKAQQTTEKIQQELAGLTMLELGTDGIVAESRAMQRVLTTAHKLAALDVSEILLLGESGTGKSMYAKLIHHIGSRKDKPFISINCAALPENLFEAELFGYERGAFTGARQNGKMGLLELAGDGTFFFDEVGEIPLSIQAKLLKCLDEREFFSLGGSASKKVRCSILAATNRDLETMVQHKQFRKDLFYRLNTFTVNIPPLRERRDDLLELAARLLDLYNSQYKTIKRLTPRALELLHAYSFPGNVRELRSLIKQGVVLSEDDVLDSFLAMRLNGKRAVKNKTTSSLPERVGSLEKELLLQATKTCTSTREMAKSLGVSQPTIVRKLRKHGLSRAADRMMQT